MTTHRVAHLSTVRARAAAASVALVGLLAGCSSSSSSGGSSESTTTVVATTTVGDTTTVAETTTTAATTTTAETTVPPTTAAPAPVCANTTAPDGSSDSLAIASGDWDGDGTDDSAISWVNLSTMDWFVRLEVSGGTSSTVLLQDVGPAPARVLDRVDVDFGLGLEPGVNRDELLAIVGSNSAGWNLGVFGLGADGCIFQFDNGGGDHFIIPVHNAAAVRSGMMCDGAAGSQFVVRLEAETSDGGLNWTTHDTRIERTGPTTLTDGITIDGALAGGSPQLNLYGRAECFGGPIVLDI